MTSQDFLAKLHSLMNEEDYQGSVDLFDRAIADLGTLKVGYGDTFRVLNFIPIKWTYMNYLGQEEQTQQEIVQFITANADNELRYKVLVNLCIVIADISSEPEELLDVIEACYEQPQRVTLATRAKIALEDNDTAAWIDAMEAFNNSRPIPEEEYDVTVQLMEGDSPALEFNSKHLQKTWINNDFPNDNAYFHAEFIKGEESVSLELPFPYNDGICEEGTLTVVRDGQQQKYTLSSNQASDNNICSPHEIKYDDGTVSVSIANVSLHSDNKAE